MPPGATPYASAVTSSTHSPSACGLSAAVAAKRWWTVVMGMVRRCRKPDVRVSWPSNEQLHRRQRRVAVQQVHPLQGHLQHAVLHRQVVEERADVELHLVALRLGVVELG